LFDIRYTITTLPLFVFKITVGKATRYEPGGRGFEPRWGLDFPYSSRLAPRPKQPLVQWASGLFPGGKAAGASR